MGPYVIVFPWLTPNNTISFFSDSYHLYHALHWRSPLSISLAEKLRHSYYAACSAGSRHHFAFKLCCFLHVHFGLFIILKQTNNYANDTQKLHIQQFLNDAVCLLSVSVVPFCVFLINQVALLAMHHSVSSVSRKWMVTWSFTQGFCILLPLRTANMGEQASRSEQQRKIWFRVSSEKFIYNITIWYLKHDCICVHWHKVPFKYS